jgi:hypothetical protein
MVTRINSLYFKQKQIPGEYLSSLYTMLQLPKSGETLKRLRSIAARNQEALSFAEALLNKFPVNNPEVPPQRNDGY